jgi:hypothetical protein
MRYGDHVNKQEADMPSHTLSYILSQRVGTIAFLERKGDACHAPVIDRNRDEIIRLVTAFMPSGSGFDSGTEFSFDKSTESRLVFNVGFHHMDEHGGYAGWTHHVVTVEATFNSANVKVSGRDRNGIKDYIADCFLPALQETVTEEWDDPSKEFTFTNSSGWKA